MLFETVDKASTNFEEQYDNESVFEREEAVRMAKTRTVDQSRPKRKRRPALTPESRENQLISLAMDVAEEQMLNGTASNQIIAHFLKLGSTRYQVEKRKLERETELLEAKTEAVKSAERVEELYRDAIKAMKSYSGAGDEEDD